MTAADIARLAGVGRAAVSNWRRRHDDFPQPVGGTATSPTFSLGQIEGWLRDQGKLADPPLRERVWQTLRQAAAADVELSDVMTFAGAFLLSLHADPSLRNDLSAFPDDRAGEALAAAVRAHTDRLPASFDAAAHVPLARALAGLADELGTADAFEFLRTRYLEHHSRRVYMTPEPVVRLMLDFATETPRTVLDPACGTGAFLTTAQDVYKNVQELLGQEIDETTARMTAVQLALRGAPAEVRPGDSLRDDAFAGRAADLVVTNPPFNDRNWGYEELTGDPRWEYGLPPRMESELAWLQHGLAHAAPGGLVVMLVPPAVAARRSGRRIRAELLRRGALRAVVGLPAGAVPNMAVAVSVWVLRRPAPGDQPADDVLMADVSAEPGAYHEAAVDAWRRYLDGRPQRGAATVVRIIDLLDDEVDLNPARHLPQRTAPSAGGAFTRERERLESAAAALPRAVTALDLLRQARGGDEPAMTTIGELAKAGVLQLLRVSPRIRMDEGTVPVLTLDDAARGRGPTGAAAPDADHVRIRARDIVVSQIARHPVARVAAEDGPVLGPGLTIVRVDPARSDPDFVAGWLRLGARGASLRSSTSSARFDVRRARLPRLTLDEQAGYGEAFRRLTDLEAALRAAQEAGDRVLTLGLEGLGAGTLRPRP
ncbi:SAM-dependent methyltransferase [Actinomadura rifamycini]|uniref:SAM-dependent methyltransferase n=1 Tax=Actinomadura rifamycini TaxID=31962 RepID=UPI000552DD36|nr:SAM-dependent methyltransferase [Actinomadura rifamycini]